MSVYAEWHWSCDQCDDASEEPWADEEAARDEHDEHVRLFHLVDRCQSCGAPTGTHDEGCRENHTNGRSER